MTKKYSVIIPTYNQPQGLVRCLDTLVVQTNKNFEIIIADDGSTDETRNVVAAFQQKNPTVALVYVRHDTNRGCAAARNTGISLAKGEILFFTDDDCEVPTNWIEEHERAYERHGDAVGVSGWYWPRQQVLQQNKYYRFDQALLNFFYPEMVDREVTSNTVRTPAGNTANASYKRSVFDAGLAFDETLTFSGNVDWDFKQRVCYEGYSLVYIPFAVQHNKEMGLWSFIKTWVRRGRGADYRARKYKNDKEEYVGSYPVITWNLFFERLVRWKNDLYTPKDLTHLFVIFLLAGLVGKYINRLRRFKPERVFRPITCQRFIRWYTHGEVVQKEEWRQFFYLQAYLKNIHAPEALIEALLPKDYYVSVVLPTYNRGNLLDATLPYLLTQSVSMQYYEILIVDDGSTDNTKEVVTKLQSRYRDRNIRYIYQENAGPASARNLGAREAVGDFVFFIDSDCVPGPDWIRMHLEVYGQHPEVAAVVGGQKVAHEVASAYDRFRNMATGNNFGSYFTHTVLLTNNTSTQILPYDTANMSYRKAVFLGLGGLDEDFKKATAEDRELAYRTQKMGNIMALIPCHVAGIRSMDYGDYKRMVELVAEWRPLLISKLAFVPQEISFASPTMLYCFSRFINWVYYPGNNTWIMFHSSIIQYLYVWRKGRV